MVVKYLEHKLQTDKPVNVAAMANEMVQSLVDVIMQLDEYHQAPALALLIATLGDEYLRRRGFITTQPFAKICDIDLWNIQLEGFWHARDTPGLVLMTVITAELKGDAVRERRERFS